MFNWKDWFDTQDNINAIQSRIVSIINNEQLEPHIYYFDGPPSTGKKTFMQILYNLLPHKNIKFITQPLDTDFIEPHIHTYFILNINLTATPMIYTLPYTKIFFWKQFTNTNRNFNKLRIKSESWIESITDGLRNDIGLPVLNIPCSSPLSRQSSCGSCESYGAFVTSLPSPYIK
jgi:hypothetical protein